MAKVWPWLIGRAFLLHAKGPKFRLQKKVQVIDDMKNLMPRELLIVRVVRSYLSILQSLTQCEAVSGAHNGALNFPPLY